MGRLSVCIVLVSAFFATGPAHSSAAVLDRFEITGNHKTLDEVILQELTIAPGDTVTDEMLDEAIQAIQNLGLFREVKIRKIERVDGSFIAEIIVREKSYNFILPKINRSGDGDWTTGVVWRSDNLFGRNISSKLTVAYKSFDDAEEDDETQVRWRYFYPRIIDTPYSLSISMGENNTNLDETVDDETGRYERQRRFLTVLGGIWLDRTGPSQGLTLSAGPSYDDYEHTFVSGTEGLLRDARVQGITMELNGYYVDDLLLSRSGYHYGFNTTLSDDIFGSDINVLRYFVFYRRYIPLAMREHSNLNYQIRGGHITESILGPPQFEIGGSSSLRGYDREAVEGNSFLILNVEFLYPMFGRDTLRGALTFDAGNAWTRDSDIDATDLRYAAGIGLRWKLQRFVRTDIRIDISHGFSDGGETKAYLGTNLTF